MDVVLLTNNNWKVVTTVFDADYAEVLHKCPKRIKVSGLSEWDNMPDKHTGCGQCQEKYPEDILTSIRLFNMHKTKKRTMADVFEQYFKQAWMSDWAKLTQDVLGDKSKEGTIKVAGDGTYFTEVKDDTP